MYHIMWVLFYAMQLCKWMLNENMIKHHTVGKAI
jgi:hypothetical protein